MEILEIFGYLGALLIGLSLGLIGGGGSILTVPILVYVLGISPVLATAYSLFVVGITSAIGSFTYFRKGLLEYRTAVVFAVPSFTSVFLTRKYLLPAIPETMELAGMVISKNDFIMIFFALIMVFASVSMIRKKGVKADEENKDTQGKLNYFMILTEGFVVGVLTGLVGAGGGFLIIPALVIFGKIPMKMAVGTSLLIIAAKSLIGFLGDLGQQSIDWVFLMVFSGISIVGIFLGSYLSRFIPGYRLKQAFGYFVLLMSAYILIRELIF